ncbi:MAG: hypothetical protein JNJ39_15590, partial [Blastocatellia bacterium]|nr:hypothetical protein [Blastocatellia bacterium]
LVRDRLGVKPLCYTATGDQFAFASTVRALKRASFGGEINIDGLTDFFEWGFVTDDHSIYDRIEKVRAGEIVEWRRGSISKRRYWDLSSEIDDKISFNDAVEETERLLLKAVECRLQSDVPVAALLSGGIDSSLVCWAIGQLGSNVRSFTIGMPGDRSDESSRARLTASELGIEHEVLELNPESPPDMISLSAAYSEPFACSSALGMLAISDRTKQSAKVLLTGDGGDDVFLGYPEHKHFYFSGELAKVLPNQVGQVWKYARSWVPGTGLAKRARSFLNYSTDGLKAVALARDGLRYYEMTNLFGPVLSGCKLQDLQLSEAKGFSQTLLMDFLNYDRRTRFVGEYLPKVDGATMYHALEARCPFLDTDLWEFTSRIPLSVRLYKGHLKAILRELVRRRMGRDLSVARKQGFTIPVQRWLGNEWKQLSVDILRNSLVQSNGFIDEAAVRRVIENGNTNTFLPKQIWYVLVLESWLRYEQTWMTER